MRVFSNLLIILNLLILLSPQFLLANENLKSNRIIQEQEVLNACSQTILRSVVTSGNGKRETGNTAKQAQFSSKISRKNSR